MNERMDHLAGSTERAPWDDWQRHQVAWQVPDGKVAAAPLPVRPSLPFSKARPPKEGLLHCQGFPQLLACLHPTYLFSLCLPGAWCWWGWLVAKCPWGRDCPLWCSQCPTRDQTRLVLHDKPGERWARPCGTWVSASHSFQESDLPRMFRSSNMSPESKTLSVLRG